MVYYGVNIFH